ncbi:MAG: GNAT family N-acetyltransferase [Lentisphaerae bacterium]|nr:GNAT family N-acetyltransferase [Lentisphaerota bacterium]
MVDKSVFDFQILDWDTEFFGVSVAKLTLVDTLTLDHWNRVRERFGAYELIVIENQNSDPKNAQFIGRETSAFLADINIRFHKNLDCCSVLPESIKVLSAMQRCDCVLELAKFKFSRFVEDPFLRERGGDRIYRQWILGSFEREDKFFAVAEGPKGHYEGFLLFSYKNGICIVELIAVAEGQERSGVGTRLFNAVEWHAHKQGIADIEVGTQIRNTNAINFYHKVGCKQIGNHQIYHLWNVHD